MNKNDFKPNILILLITFIFFLITPIFAMIPLPLVVILLNYSQFKELNQFILTILSILGFIISYVLACLALKYYNEDNFHKDSNSKIKLILRVIGYGVLYFVGYLILGMVVMMQLLQLFHG
jgi:hypothetical protein